MGLQIGCLNTFELFAVSQVEIVDDEIDRIEGDANHVVGRLRHDQTVTFPADLALENSAMTQDHNLIGRTCQTGVGADQHQADGEAQSGRAATQRGATALVRGSLPLVARFLAGRTTSSPFTARRMFRIPIMARRRVCEPPGAVKVQSGEFRVGRQARMIGG